MYEASFGFEPPEIAQFLRATPGTASLDPELARAFGSIRQRYANALRLANDDDRAGRAAAEAHRLLAVSP